MPNLRRLSGQDVIRILESFGFAVVAQKGSHIKLRRMGPNEERQTLTIPNHDELDTGMLRALLRQASRYIALEKLQPHFYR